MIKNRISKCRSVFWACLVGILSSCDFESITGVQEPDLGPEIELDDQVFLVSASSVVGDFKGYSFAPHLVMDDNMETCWQESNSAVKGEREYITVFFEKTVDISQIRIANGCQSVSGKYGDLYDKNPRARQIYVNADGGDSASLVLPDSREMYTENVNLKNVNHLTFQIGSVYPGKKWQDASISELSFVGRLSKEASGGAIAPAYSGRGRDGVQSSKNTLRKCDDLECYGRLSRKGWRASLDLEQVARTLPDSCDLGSLSRVIGQSTAQPVQFGALKNASDSQVFTDVWPMVGVGAYIEENLKHGDEVGGTCWSYTGQTLVLGGVNPSMENAWRIAYACVGLEGWVDDDISNLSSVMARSGTQMLKQGDDDYAGKSCDVTADGRSLKLKCQNEALGYSEVRISVDSDQITIHSSFGA
jgi:hypothetical protein